MKKRCSRLPRHRKDGHADQRFWTRAKTAGAIGTVKTAIVKHSNEDKQPAEGGEFFRSRGIGLDACTCFVCGTDDRDGEGHCMLNNIAAYVQCKKAGERVVAMFPLGALLDCREHEPDSTQVKIGACDRHLLSLKNLHEACADGHITVDRISAAVLLAEEEPLVTTEELVEGDTTGVRLFQQITDSEAAEAAIAARTRESAASFAVAATEEALQLETIQRDGRPPIKEIDPSFVDDNGQLRECIFTPVKNIPGLTPAHLSALEKGYQYPLRDYLDLACLTLDQIRGVGGIGPKGVESIIAALGAVGLAPKTDES